MQIGRETAVHAQDALVDDCRDGQIVEHGAEVAPQAYGVATLTLIVEAVQTCDGNALVVTTQHKYLVRMLDLVRQQQTHGLNTLLAAINKVADQKELVDGRRSAGYLEQTKHIVELAVEVASDLDGCLKLEQCRLLLDNFLRLPDDPFNSFLVQVHKRVDLERLRLVQLEEDHVEGELAHPSALGRRPVLGSFTMQLQQVQLVLVGQVLRPN